MSGKILTFPSQAPFGSRSTKASSSTRQSSAMRSGYSCGSSREQHGKRADADQFLVGLRFLMTALHKDLGFPVKTIRRWRGMLVRDGYIAAQLASHGFRYTILKSKKWQGRPKAGLPKLPTSSDRGLPPRAPWLPAAGNQRVCILNDNTGTTQKEEAEEATAAALANSIPGQRRKEREMPGSMEGGWYKASRFSEVHPSLGKNLR